MSSARTRGTGAGAGRSGAAAVDAKVQRRTCDARRVVSRLGRLAGGPLDFDNHRVLERVLLQET